MTSGGAAATHSTSASPCAFSPRIRRRGFTRTRASSSQNVTAWSHPTAATRLNAKASSPSPMCARPVTSAAPSPGTQSFTLWPLDGFQTDTTPSLAPTHTRRPAASYVIAVSLASASPPTACASVNRYSISPSVKSQTQTQPPESALAIWVNPGEGFTDTATAGRLWPTLAARSMTVSFHSFGDIDAVSKREVPWSKPSAPIALTGKYDVLSSNDCTHARDLKSHTRTFFSTSSDMICDSLSTSIRCEMDAPWPYNTSTGLDVSGFHSKMVLSTDAVRSSLNLGDHATALTPPLCPCNVLVRAPNAFGSTSTSFTVLSSDPLTMTSSSFTYCTDVTQSSWSFRVHLFSNRTLYSDCAFSPSVMSIACNTCTYPPSSPTAIQSMSLCPGAIFAPPRQDVMHSGAY
mmetsp:Transcript_7595/g.27723  ORF Transcript_7595/g.27723 Transcript_7595/m.27723 type:complete len:404 (-) Transcript_7595:819-2030(-)